MYGIERVFTGNNWVTLMLLFAIVLLFFMKVFQPTRLYGYAIAFFSKGFMEKRAEERPKVTSPFHITLFSFATLVISLFVFLATEPIHKSLNFSSFLSFMLVIITYLFFRFLIDLSIGKLLNIYEGVRYFLFTKAGYLYSLSLLLLPVIIIYLYTFKNTYFLLISFFTLFLFRFWLVLYNNKKLILNNLFYFILYLCALEIAPLFLVYKLFAK